MKNTLFLIICFTFFLNATAQRFSVVHPNMGGGPAINIVQTDSGYVSVCKYVYSNNLVDFMTFDSEGELIDMRSHADTNVTFTENGDKSLLLKDNRFYLSNTKFIQSDSTYVSLVKLNQDFDTLQQQNLWQYEGYTPQCRALQFDTDSTMVITGFLYRSPNSQGRQKYDLWVARLDTAFNVLWQQRVEDTRPSMNDGYRGLDMVVDVYNSILITGSYNVDFGPWQGLNRSFAARLDQKTGRLHWLKEYRSSQSDPDAGAEYMFALDEGNGTYSFIDVQHASFVPNTIGPDSSRIRFGYMDTTGMIVWDTLIGPIAQQYYPRDLHKTSSGNYYIAGQLASAGPFKSFGFVFNSQGDSINYVIHRHKDSVQNENALIRENLWNFQPTPDGGFIHIGNWVDPDTNQNIVNTWLLKTDEYGCKVEGCQISLPEARAKPSLLDVYPNPTTGRVYLESSLRLKDKSLKLVLYTMDGRKVLEKTHTLEQQNYLEMGHLPPGLYLIQVFQSGRSLGTLKIQKE